MKNKSTSTEHRMVLKALLGIMACVVLMHSCFPGRDYKTEIIGTFYTDSTLSMPVANDTLVVIDCEMGKVGISLTDDSGHFAFSYWSNGGDAHPNAKFQMYWGEFYLCDNGDTLCILERHNKYENVVLYRGQKNWRGGWYAK